MQEHLESSLIYCIRPLVVLNVVIHSDYVILLQCCQKAYTDTRSLRSKEIDVMSLEIPEINHLFPFLASIVQCLEMTTKRKLIGRLVPCRCFRGEEEVISVLDYSHCSLQQVPKEIFSFERTLEELYLDANQIEELPKVTQHRNTDFLLQCDVSP